MRYWHLDRPAPAGQLDLSQVTGLVAAIGQADATSFAAEVLNTLGEAAKISQCTIFAYEFGNRPRTVSVADRRGGRFLRDVADVYSKLYYVLDGNQGIVTATQAARPGASMVIHQQTSDDIAHEGYRAACYSDPNVCDRLSLLLQPADHIWLSVNLYRDRMHAEFPAAGNCAGRGAGAADRPCGQTSLCLARPEPAGHPATDAGAPAQRLPVAGQARTRRRAWRARRLHRAEIGEILGIKPASVVTYQKRAYQRLGISSQRQLFALCLSGEKP